MTTSAIRRLTTLVGLDEQVLATLLFRSWSTAAGAATVIVAPLFLTPVEQGYYYTFGSVLGLQVFFELGLNQIVVQLASHEAAHLARTPAGGFDGAAAQMGRLASLARLLSHWYKVSALLFAIVGGGLGAAFFLRKAALPAGAWVGVWSLLVGCTALNLFFSSKLALLEGCGGVGPIARLRLKQAIAGSLLLWALLACGAGLWAAVAIPLAAVVGTGTWLLLNGQALRALERRAPDASHRLLWRRDVLPFQWRIALSWISGFFIFNLFTPLVFSRQGAIEAGRLGLALTVFSGASAVGMSWISAKTPAFAGLISRGERAALNTLFRATALRSVSFTGLICAGVVAAAAVLGWLDSSVMQRLASLPVLAVLAVMTTANVFVFCLAAYMRAHREEPLLAQSVAAAVLIGGAVFLASRLGVLPMMLSYLGIGTFVTTPWAVLVFLRYYRRP